MLHHDDLPEGEYRWVEYRVRMLVPMAPLPEMTLDARFIADINRSETCDVGSLTPLGKPGRCGTCGLVTVETAGFPWGEDRYHFPSYCPHCTGGEDVG